MSSYKKGAKLEYKVRDLLARRGYFVVRSAGSRGPFDLVALKKGEVLLVQCRADGRVSEEERRELVELARSVGAKAFLAYKEEGIVKLVELVA
ncbi:MAG: hypothetical protein QXU64_05185 [Thermofilaceae archaeon]